MRLAVGPLLLLAVVLSRLLFLDADPPGLVHPNFATDEGWWAHAAKNHLHAGRFVLDEHNTAFYLAPLHTALVRLSYESLGPSLASTRLPGALAGILVCLFGAAMAHSERGRRSGLLAFALLGSSFFLFCYARIAMVESLQLAVLTAAALAALIGATRTGWAAASGALVMVSLLAKPSGVAVGLACALFLAAISWEQRRPAKLLAFAAGAGLAALILGVFWVLPHSEGIATELGYQFEGTSRDGSLLRMLLSFANTPRPEGSHLQAFLAPSWWALSAALVVSAQRGRPPARGPLAQLSWLWLLSGLLLVALQWYQPERRLLLVVPPLAILLVLQLAELARPGARTDGSVASETSAGVVDAFRKGVPAILMTGAAVAVLAFDPLNAFWREATRALPLGEQPGLSSELTPLLVWTTALAAVTGLHLAAARLPRSWFEAIRPAWILVPLLAFELGPVSRALLTPTMTFRDATRHVALEVSEEPPGCRIVQGKLADTLALASDARAFHVREWKGWSVLDQDGFRRHRPRFFVAGRRPDGRPWAPPLRAPVERLEQLERFELWPDRSGRPRLSADFYRVPGEVQACGPRDPRSEP